MALDPKDERKLARRTRHAALIIALSMGYWIAAQMLGARLGWDPRLAFVFDIAAILALIWALWIVFQIYRARRNEP
ncbi:MAG: DUF5337 domain-containing protein [Pseudomonadota bacterium]